MEKVEIVAALESSKWENGKWKFGIKVRIPKNIVALQSYIFANIVWGMRKAVKFWGDIERNVCGGILQDTKYTGKHISLGILSLLFTLICYMLENILKTKQDNLLYKHICEIVDWN